MHNINKRRELFMTKNEYKLIKNTIDIELNNLVIELIQNGYREDLAKNLVKTRKDNILWAIEAEINSNQKSGD